MINKVYRLEKLTDKELKGIICIYRIYTKHNGMSYIGSTVDLKQRINSHVKKLSDNKHDNPRLQNSWNVNKDMGTSAEWNFYFEILEVIEDVSFLPFAELYYIEKYKRINGVYNINNPLQENKVLKYRKVTYQKDAPKEKKPKKKKEKRLLTKSGNFNNRFIKEELVKDFEEMFEKMEERVKEVAFIDFEKVFNFVLERLPSSLIEVDKKTIEDNLARVIRSRNMSVYSFDSLSYSRQVLNKHGINEYKKSIINKEFAKRLMEDMNEWKSSL